jgi:hypothetical protein
VARHRRGPGAAARRAHPPARLHLISVHGGYAPNARLRPRITQPPAPAPTPRPLPPKQAPAPAEWKRPVATAAPSRASIPPTGRPRPASSSSASRALRGCCRPPPLSPVAPRDAKAAARLRFKGSVLPSDWLFQHTFSGRRSCMGLPRQLLIEPCSRESSRWRTDRSESPARALHSSSPNSAVSLMAWRTHCNWVKICSEVNIEALCERSKRARPNGHSVV